MTGYNFQNRRDFIKYVIGTSAALYGLNTSAQNELLQKKGIEKLNILYTNDTHSRIEPFPANDAKHANQGGFAKRAELIQQLRQQNNEVLLLDAGDVFQGTPYFNFYHGEIEYKLMSLMQYDATTFGNHDFDLGCENIVKQMPHASFDFINCNYSLKNTALVKHKKIAPYKIYKKGRLKIGVLGVGIELNDLVDKKFIGEIVYNNPIEEANKISAILKHDEKCDYIICLSHLGYKYPYKKISDIDLAQQTKYIDLIIGGHTHTFLKSPETTLNAESREVKITQVGWAGIWLGNIEVYFEHNNHKISENNTNHKI